MALIQITGVVIDDMLNMCKPGHFKPLCLSSQSYDFMQKGAKGPRQDHKCGSNWNKLP